MIMSALDGLLVGCPHTIPPPQLPKGQGGVLPSFSMAACATPHQAPISFLQNTKPRQTQETASKDTPREPRRRTQAFRRSFGKNHLCSIPKSLALRYTDRFPALLTRFSILDSRFSEIDLINTSASVMHDRTRPASIPVSSSVFFHA